MLDIEYFKKIVYLFQWCVILFMFIVIVYLLCMQKSPSINVECVPTENKAIEIGKVVCSSVYPQINLEEQKWECIENTEKNEWIVFCYKGYVLGGGLPEIHINKTTAEITSISLVK